MPRVKQVVARKDYPDYRIAKGQKHYFWVLKTGPRSSRTYRQVEPPRPSQLTTSEFLGRVGDMEIDIKAFAHDSTLPDTLREFAEEVRALGEEQQEKYDNMPDGLRDGPTGEMLQERADGAASWADEIESAADSLGDKIEEIEGKAWFELEEFGSYSDEEDAIEALGEAPDEDEIESARQGEIATACDEAIGDCDCPGFG